MGSGAIRGGGGYFIGVLFGSDVRDWRPLRAVDPEATAPSVTVAQEVAIASVSEPVVSSTPDQLEVPSPPHRRTVSVLRSTEIAQATSPALARPNQVAAAPNRMTTRPVQLRARTQTPATPVQPAKLTRRLARFIAGDGKYNVKPFPTVGTSGS